ncbi:helix-turn-helix domain-containing protein [Actinopolyspora alba]|nr:helix-turn-helix transcriptional regulator [Actinopolyspora alba]
MNKTNVGMAGISLHRLLCIVKRADFISNMGKELQRGPTSDRVRRNIEALRSAQGLSLAELSRRLEAVGRPILGTGIHKIEQGVRRVDVDDLVALALALNVTPNRLLLPVDGSRVELTSEVEVEQRPAWNWADGIHALEEAIQRIHGEAIQRTHGEALTAAYGDFKSHSRPTGEVARDQHTATRAARDVLDRIHLILGNETRMALEDAIRQAVEYGNSSGNAAMLRRALNRLNAEVEDLIGDEGD